MVRYKCHKCRADLESPESMQGGHDKCPICGTMNTVPAPSVRYRCGRCKASLESPGTLAGQEDTCPKCGHTQTVPPSEQQRAEERQRLRMERDRQERVRQAHERQEAEKLTELRRKQTEEARRRHLQEEAASPVSPVPSSQAAMPPLLNAPSGRRGRRVAAGAGGGGALLLIAGIALYGMSRSGTLGPLDTTFNPPGLQGPMNDVIRDDVRNDGIAVSVHYDSFFGSSTLIYDLRGFSGSKSMADIFRVFLQFAAKMQNETFAEVHLCYKGQLKFRLDGRYFKTLGLEYSYQNPAYTMRTFPEHLMTPHGLRAYSVWEGGILGVLQKQMEDFNDFHHKWYLDDMVVQ